MGRKKSALSLAGKGLVRKGAGVRKEKGKKETKTTFGEKKKQLVNVW